MHKTRINISLDEDLAEFVKVFAAENRISVADIITQYLLGLKRSADRKETQQILSHPAFGEAMKECRVSTTQRERSPTTMVATGDTQGHTSSGSWSSPKVTI
jgi:hypothetical protein